MPDAAPAWSLTSAEALKQFQSSARGLGAAEARRRRQDAGPNEISREAARPGWRIFADQFASPLVLILIGASIMSFALGERTETVIILLMVFLGLSSGIAATHGAWAIPAPLETSGDQTDGDYRPSPGPTKAAKLTLPTRSSATTTVRIGNRLSWLDRLSFSMGAILRLSGLWWF